MVDVVMCVRTVGRFTHNGCPLFIIPPPPLSFSIGFCGKIKNHPSPNPPWTWEYSAATKRDPKKSQK